MLGCIPEKCVCRCVVSIEWQNSALGIEGESLKVTGMFELEEEVLIKMTQPLTIAGSFIIRAHF